MKMSDKNLIRKDKSEKHGLRFDGTEAEIILGPPNKELKIICKRDYSKFSLVIPSPVVALQQIDDADQSKHAHTQTGQYNPRQIIEQVWFEPPEPHANQQKYKRIQQHKPFRHR